MNSKTNNRSFLIATFIIVAIYFTINYWVVYFDETAFYYNIKSWNLIQSKPSLYFLICISFCLLFFKNIRNSLRVKNNFPKIINRGIHILIILVAWYYLFYDFNFYANQWHILDRLLVLLLAILSINFPVFTLLFVAQIYLVDFQFNFPLGGSKLLDKILVLEILKIWTAYHILYHFQQFFNKKKPSVQAFYFTSVMFYGYFYFLPGLQKIVLSGDLNWPFDNEILYNLLSIRNKGWLNNMPSWLIDLHYNYFKIFGTIGQLAILALEIGAAFVLINKKWLKAFIVLIIFFHFHVFILNGALFWLWIFSGVFIFQITKYISNDLFSLKNVLISFIFYSVANWGIFSANLGWYDSPLDNYFEIKMEDKFGRVSKVSFGDFQPYTLHLQYGNILNTIKSKNIYSGFLILDKDIFKSVMESDSSNIVNLIKSEGIDRYSYEMEKNLFRFFDCYVHNSSPNPYISDFLNHIQAPNYWNAHLTDNIKPAQKKDIKILKVYHICTYRRLGKEDQILWKNNVCQVEKGVRYLK